MVECIHLSARQRLCKVRVDSKQDTWYVTTEVELLLFPFCRWQNWGLEIPPSYDNVRLSEKFQILIQHSTNDNEAWTITLRGGRRSWASFVQQSEDLVSFRFWSILDFCLRSPEAAEYVQISQNVNNMEILTTSAHSIVGKWHWACAATRGGMFYALKEQVSYEDLVHIQGKDCGAVQEWTGSGGTGESPRVPQGQLHQGWSKSDQQQPQLNYL